MTTQDLINTLKQGKPMTDRLMREIVRELEEKTEQVRTMSTALRAKDADYVALREAVAWERECCQDIRPLFAWSDLYARHGEDYVDAIADALREIQDAASAEVDRLLEEKH